MQSQAGSATFCVSCVEPDRTYVCRVDTPNANPGPDALQFYCIVRTAKEEQHKSCAVTKGVKGQCSGIEKHYTYNGPALPPQLQDVLPTPPQAPGPQSEPPTVAAPDFSEPAPLQLVPPSEQPAPVENKRPPETLIEMGTRAGSTVRNAAGNTGQAVRGAARGTGNVANESGSRVGNAARNVGQAARTAVGCVWSLFRNCGSDDTAQPQDNQF